MRGKSESGYRKERRIEMNGKAILASDQRFGFKYVTYLNIEN